MFPQQAVGSDIDLVAGIFGNGTQAFQEGRPEGDASHGTVPFAVATALPFAVSQMETNAVSFYVKMFGGGNINISEYLILVFFRQTGFMSIIVCRDGIIASYSNARLPFIFFNGSDFHGKITVFMIKTDIILIAVLQSFLQGASIS